MYFNCFKFFLSFIFLLCVAVLVSAQDAELFKFRKVIASADSHFEKIKSKKYDAKNGRFFYKTKIKHTGVKAAYIAQSTTDTNYYIVYEWNTVNSQIYKKQQALLNQYTEELDRMVQSGNYVAEVYDDEDSNSNVTRITDKKGKLILDLRSDDELFYFIIYHLNKNPSFP